MSNYLIYNNANEGLTSTTYPDWSDSWVGLINNTDTIGISSMSAFYAGNSFGTPNGDGLTSTPFQFPLAPSTGNSKWAMFRWDYVDASTTGATQLISFANKIKAYVEAQGYSHLESNLLDASYNFELDSSISDFLTEIDISNISNLSVQEVSYNWGTVDTSANAATNDVDSENESSSTGGSGQLQGISHMTQSVYDDRVFAYGPKRNAIYEHDMRGGKGFYDAQESFWNQKAIADIVNTTDLDVCFTDDTIHTKNDGINEVQSSKYFSLTKFAENYTALDVYSSGQVVALITKMLIDIEHGTSVTTSLKNAITNMQQTSEHNLNIIN